MPFLECVKRSPRTVPTGRLIIQIALLNTSEDRKGVYHYESSVFC